MHTQVTANGRVETTSEEMLTLVYKMFIDGVSLENS